MKNGTNCTLTQYYVLIMYKHVYKQFGRAKLDQNVCAEHILL